VSSRNSNRPPSEYKSDLLGLRQTTQFYFKSRHCLTVAEISITVFSLQPRDPLSFHALHESVSVTDCPGPANRTVPFSLSQALPPVRRSEQGPLATAAEASTSSTAFRSVSSNWTQPTVYSEVTHVENEYVLWKYITEVEKNKSGHWEHIL